MITETEPDECKMQRESQGGCPWFLDLGLPAGEFEKKFKELFRDKDREEDD